MPAAGSIMPGQNKTAYSRGPNVDAIFKRMDHEDLLKKISAHPVAQRKALLRAWYQRQR